MCVTGDAWRLISTLMKVRKTLLVGRRSSLPQGQWLSNFGSSNGVIIRPVSHLMCSLVSYYMSNLRDFFLHFMNIFTTYR